MKKFARHPTANSNERPQADDAREKAAMRLAERTDVSPKQARELLDRHGGDVAAAEREARNFKAES